MLVTEEEAKTKEKTAPPKRWRNRWYSGLIRWFDENVDESFNAEFWATNTYPSKEIAEQKAREVMRKLWFLVVLYRVRYIGAFQVGEES